MPEQVRVFYEASMASGSPGARHCICRVCDIEHRAGGARSHTRCISCGEHL